MKTSTSALLLLCHAFFFCCISPDYTLFPQEHRNAFRNGIPVNGGSNGKSAKDADTILYVCGVVFPDGYEWRRDSSLNRTPGDLLLLRNGESVLRLKTGPREEISDDPDMHHLIGGHLYTEYSTPNQTIIKRDGKEVLRYNGREFLKGLLPQGEDLFTLGQNRSGEGFSFRRNGEPLAIKNTGTIKGGFGSVSTDRHGALCEDNGHILFRYSFKSEVFLMVDGAEHIGREPALTEPHRLSAFENYVVSSSPSGPLPFFLYTLDNYFFLNGDFSEERYLFYPPEAYDFAGSHYFIAATPFEDGEKPVLITESGTRTLDFNGFVTEIELIEILPGDDP